MFQFFCVIFNFCWLFKNKKKNVYFSFIHQFVCESAKILFLFLILKILFRIFFKNLNLVFIDNHFFRSYKTGKLKIKMLFFFVFYKNNNKFIDFYFYNNKQNNCLWFLFCLCFYFKFFFQFLLFLTNFWTWNLIFFIENYLKILFNLWNYF